MFLLLDSPVETTECGTQTKWDYGNGDGMCNGNGWWHSESNGDSVDDWCNGNGDGMRNGDTIGNNDGQWTVSGQQQRCWHW